MRVRNVLFVVQVTLLGLLGFSGLSHGQSFSELINLAEQNDPAYKSAMNMRDAAFYNIGISRAKLLPQVYLQGTYQTSNVNQSTQLRSIDTKSNSKNSQAVFRQALFKPRDWLGMSIGRLQAEYGQYKYESVQSDLWRRTIVVWAEFVAASKNVEAQRAALESTKKAYQQSIKSYRSGEGVKDQVAEAKAQLDQIEAVYHEAIQLVGAKKKILADLIGQPVDKFYFENIHFDKITMNSTIESLYHQKLMDSSPEILSAKITEQINKKKVDQFQYDHLPTVDLVATYTKAQNDSVNTLGLTYTTSQIGVQVIVPIFTGGGTNALHGQSQSIYLASVSDTQALEKKMLAQTYLDLSAYNSLKQKMNAARELVISAQEQKISATRGLKAGIRTWAEVSNIDILLARRWADYHMYSHQYIGAQVNLLSNLPVTDELWAAWIGQLDILSKSKK